METIINIPLGLPLGLKDSSRDFFENYAIIFFRLRLVLHACVQTLDSFRLL
jgi:hypothetical protein